MIECPKCRMVFERQVKFCERCRYQFTGRDHQRSSPITTILILAVGALFTMAVIIGVFGGKRKVDASSRVTHPVFIGETRSLNQVALCGSTLEALNEMQKWAARHDTGEVARVAVQTHSIFLDKGMLVKVLADQGFIIREDKIRIVGGVSNGDLRVGRECWIEAETIDGK